jgi:hypothetical protein
MEGSRTVVAERRVTRLQPFETPELTGTSGKKELVVVLARQPQRAPSAKPQSPATVFQVADAGQLSQRDQSEHAVYEVATGVNLLSPVLVRITLNFQ